MENPSESHKAVEIGDLRILAIQEWGGYPIVQPCAERRLTGRREAGKGYSTSRSGSGAGGIAGFDGCRIRRPRAVV